MKNIDKEKILNKLCGNQRQIKYFQMKKYRLLIRYKMTYKGHLKCSEVIKNFKTGYHKMIM